METGDRSETGSCDSAALGTVEDTNSRGRLDEREDEAADEEEADEEEATGSDTTTFTGGMTLEAWG